MDAERYRTRAGKSCGSQNERCATDTQDAMLVPVLGDGMRLLVLLALLGACRKDPISLSLDFDGDGFGAESDCNDEDDSVYPGAPEICDGIDNDCSGAVDDDVVDAVRYFPDDDGDGYGIERGSVFACEAPEGFVPQGGDCHDGDLTIYPGAPELCDNLDNDCNGLVEDDGVVPWYPDSDSDGIGAIGIALDACEPPEGFVSVTGDCDDADHDVLPGAIEVCDGIDNNCDGRVDEDLLGTFYADSDGDGYGTHVQTTACELPEGFAVDGGDCNDESDQAYPGGTEVCDYLDNNCDGVVDEGLRTLYYPDVDGDDYGIDALARSLCEQPEDWVVQGGDCDDANRDHFPGAVEICDSVDNNCNDQVDEGLGEPWYVDADGDGFGDEDRVVVACEAPSDLYVMEGRDCDDLDDEVNPDATDLCDDTDRNCDGLIGFDEDGDGLSDEACGGSDCNDDDEEMPLNEPCTKDSCLSVLQANPDAVSGPELIDPDDDGPMEAIEVSCDQDFDDGGWTLVMLVDDLGGSGRISGERNGFQRADFIHTFGHNRFTDATWSYDAATNTVSEGLNGLVWGMDQGGLDIELFAGRWTDIRMTCNTADRATGWSHWVMIPDYSTTNGNYQLLGSAANGASYSVLTSTNSMGLSTVWHDNELATQNSHHYLCDNNVSSSVGTTQFGFCYTNHLSNTNNQDMGDSLVSLAFGSSGTTDIWSYGFTGECGDMGTNAQQNNGSYAIWVR